MTTNSYMYNDTVGIKMSTLIALANFKQKQCNFLHVQTTYSLYGKQVSKFVNMNMNIIA